MSQDWGGAPPPRPPDPGVASTPERRIVAIILAGIVGFIVMTGIAVALAITLHPWTRSSSSPFASSQGLATAVSKLPAVPGATLIASDNKIFTYSLPDTPARACSLAFGAYADAGYLIPAGMNGDEVVVKIVPQVCSATGGSATIYLSSLPAYIPPRTTSLPLKVEVKAANSGETSSSEIQISQA
jgi:hypothetical protein